jgi:hypothetical protein
MRSLLRRAVSILALLVLVAVDVSDAQECTDWSRPRAYAVGGAYVVGVAATAAIRGGDWWRGEPTGSFKVVWDGTPALGQDYLLRAYTAYQLSQVGGLAFRWACLSPRTSAWLGAGFAAAVWLPKEIGDGFHEKGVSIADITASTIGALLPALRYENPVLAAVQYKFNYWPSSEFRNRTGTDPQLESDYAGMRFFLAYNPGLVETNPEWWPEWLGVAVGHSINQWIAGPPEHQWYLTLDVNARGLPITASWWPSVAAVIDQIKIPLPGLRFQGGSVAGGLF